MSHQERVPNVRSGTVRLVSRIERRQFQPDLCTIYDPEAEGYELMATWITASEGSYVSLEAWR